MGVSRRPGVSVTPMPMGCTASSVPCTTETTPCSVRAVAKLTSARLRPASTACCAAVLNAGHQHSATPIASKAATTAARSALKLDGWPVADMVRLPWWGRSV